MRKKLFIVLLVLFAVTVNDACTPESYESFGNISGMVIDMETGEPLDDVLISLQPKNKPNIYTGLDGQFEFRDLEEDQYTVTAIKTGYKADRTLANVIPGETVSVSLVMEKK